MTEATPKSTMHRVISDLAEAKGWSIAALAREAGMTKQQLYLVLERKSMGLRTLARLALCLGVESSHILAQIERLNAPQPKVRKRNV